MTTQYDYSVKINNFMQCQRLQAVAQECIDVRVVDSNGSQANAKVCSAL